MKPISLAFAVFTLAVGISGHPCRASGTNAPADLSEDLGVDFYQGRTNKIVNVYAVTPTHIQVVYESGSRSRQISRTELSGELARRYPYDAEKASAYLSQKSAEAAQRAAAQQAVWQAVRQTAVTQQEKAIEVEIERLSQRDAQLQKEVNVLTRLPRGNGRKVRLAHLVNEQQSIRERVTRLNTQRSALR